MATKKNKNHTPAFKNELASSIYRILDLKDNHSDLLFSSEDRYVELRKDESDDAVQLEIDSSSSGVLFFYTPAEFDKFINGMKQLIAALEKK